MYVQKMWQRLTHFFQRKLTKEFIKYYYVPLVYPVFGLLLFLTWWFFPKPYVIGTQAISNLGNHVLNPFPGWLFFSIAISLLAVVQIPLIFYAHSKLVKVFQRTTKIGTTANFIGVIGMILVAIFPDQPATLLWHVIGAFCAFGGIGCGAIIYWMVLIKEALLHAIKHRIIVLILAIVIILGILIFIVFIGLVQLIHIHIGVFIKPLYLKFPFWEWALFTIIIVHLMVNYILIPKKVIVDKK
jgi:hypothetical protein